MNRKTIQRLSEKIASTFGDDKVVSILLHGSVLFNPHLPSHDVDVVIVLRRKDAGDCSLLRKLVGQSRLGSLPIHLHLIYLEEIPTNADFFSLHTCGPFFVCHLRQAEILFGENIFNKISGPTDYHLQLSLLQKIQQYTFQLRNQIFRTGKVSGYEMALARKRSIVVLKDLLMSDGILLQQETEIVTAVGQRFPELWTKLSLLIQEVVQETAKPLSDKKTRHYLQQCLAIPMRIRLYAQTDHQKRKVSVLFLTQRVDSFNRLHALFC